MALRLEEPFETWDLVKLQHLDPNLSRKRHYKTIATQLQSLVDRGYLVHETKGAGGQGGRHGYRFARDKSHIATHYIDRFLDQLGDDPELLELAKERARHRLVDRGARSDSRKRAPE